MAPGVAAAVDRSTKSAPRPNECAANDDSVTKKVFEALVAEEEVHLDQYETELDNLDKFGNNYLALNRSSAARWSWPR